MSILNCLSWPSDFRWMLLLYQYAKVCHLENKSEAYAYSWIVVWWFPGTYATYRLFSWQLFADMITKYSHWIAFILLLFIGGNMIKESFDEEENVNADMGVKNMFLLAVATSIDALAVGVSLAFLKVNIIPAVSFIGCITFVCSAAGVK